MRLSDPFRADTHREIRLRRPQPRFWRIAVTHSAVPIVGSANQELPIDQDLEDLRAGLAIERPEPLRLKRGELQAWHLQVLALDASEQLVAKFIRHREALTRAAASGRASMTPW
jgi:hypothetical protein